ncbi:MAG: hypothetical protein AAF960_20050 [Bacteroidota bacterium]
MIKYILCPLCVLLLSLPLSAQEITPVEAMNKASHQRMLTQKMFNCYIKQGMGTEAALSREEMELSVAAFEEDMIELMDFAPNEEVVTAIEKAQNAWRIYSLKVLSYPNKIMGSVVFDWSGKIMREYDDLVQLMAQQIGTEPAKLVSLTGRQQMLAQRVQMLHLSQKWGLSQKKINKERALVNEDFRSTLKTLSAAEVNLPSMVESLNQISQDWEFIQAKFDQKTMASTIVLTTENMQQRLGEIMDMYFELSKIAPAKTEAASKE